MLHCIWTGWSVRSWLFLVFWVWVNLTVCGRSHLKKKKIRNKLTQLWFFLNFLLLRIPQIAVWWVHSQFILVACIASHCGQEVIIYSSWLLLLALSFHPFELNFIPYRLCCICKLHSPLYHQTKEERKIYRLKTALKIMCYNKLLLYLRHHEDSTNPGVSLIRIIFLFLMKSERKYYNSMLIILYIISGWVRLTHSTWMAKL